MPPTPASDNVIRFGLFAADLAARELRKRGRKIPLQDQPFRVLTLLLQRPGELIPREEFQKTLWPGDTFVEFDEGLNKAIQKLRQALDDSSDNPRFIETLPRKGYRFIAPVTGNGTEAAPEKAEPPVQPAAQRPSRERLAWLLLGAVLIVLVVFTGIYFRFLRPPAQAALKTVPLTTYPGRQVTPALSPDGKQVAFAWDGEEGNNFDIYVKLVGAGSPLRLTSNPAPDAFPAWSPDGRYIAFCREVSEHVEIWIVPALGGGERKLGEATRSGLSWSPDGRFLALVDKDPPQVPPAMFLLSIETGEKLRLTSPRNSEDYAPSFAPDGRTLAFIRGNLSDIGEVYVLPLTADERPAGEPRRLTFDERNVTGLDWTPDSKRIVYSSSNLPGGWRLWMVPASGGQPERLAIAGDNAYAVSISHADNRLVYTREMFTASIWRAPGLTSSDKKSPPVRIIASTRGDWEPHISPNGERVVFSSSRSGNQELWSCDREGRNPVQLTSLGGPDPGSPRWSPDGRWIAFDWPKTGNYNIYVMNADGGPSRRLTTGPFSYIRPSWSGDGRWIYFGSTRSGDYQIWKAPAQGGPEVQVTRMGGSEALESPDGKSLYFAKPNEPGIWSVPVDGGEVTRVLDHRGEGDWTLTKQGIVFFDLSQPAGPAIKLYSFTTHNVTLFKQLSRETRINSGANCISASPDGSWLIYTQVDQLASDLMLVENFR